MRLSSVRRGVLASVVLLLALPAGLAAAGTGHPTSAAATGKPKVGACYDLTFKQIGHDTSAAKSVPCSRTHTTLTAGVPDLPQGAYSASADKLAVAQETACLKPLAATVGGSVTQRALTNYSFAYFSPTKAEQHSGARWVRCDVILVGKDGVQPLPSTSSPLLRHGITDSVRRCYNATNDSVTTCNHPHTFRAVHAFTASMAKHPSPKQAASIAAKGCPRYTGSRYYYSYATPFLWSHDIRYFACFKPDTH